MSSKSLREQIEQSPDYRRMVALLNIAWLVSDVHHADAAYPDLPPTPRIKGYSKKYGEDPLTAFCALVAQAADAHYQVVDLDERGDDPRRNVLDLTVHDSGGMPHFVLRLTKKDHHRHRGKRHGVSGWEKDDVLMAYAAVSQAQHLLNTGIQYHDALERDPDVYFKSHWMFLHCLAKSGIGFMEQFLPGRDQHVKQVTRSVTCAVEQLENLGCGTESQSLNTAHASLAALTASCHDLGSAMLEWMAIEGKDPVMRALRAEAGKLFNCDKDDDRAVDACLHLAVGRRFGSEDSALLCKRVDAGAIEGMENWSALLKYLTDWHSQLIEISTRSPSLIGIRAAALHHMDFQGERSSPGYLEAFRDDRVSLLDALVPIMDKLDAGYNARVNKARQNQTEPDTALCFSHSLCDLAQSQIGANGNRVPNAAVDIGLLRTLFDHGVFDQIAKTVYAANIPLTERNVIAASFDERCIPARPLESLAIMGELDQSHARWIRRLESEPAAGRSIT